MEDKGRTDSHREKYEKLKESLCKLKNCAVAFSGGVDSALLLKTAHDVLGDRAVAVTASAEFFSGRELREAEAFCEAEGIRQVLCPTGILKMDEFRKNPPNRCYFCKRELFTKLIATAEQLGLACVIEGSNMDDDGDYRPGLAALRELSVKSPLREAGLWKSEIRVLSRELNLPTWDKPSFACLASRFPYGDEITEIGLSMVERAEEFLLEKGFRQVRVRIHDRLARIELLPGDFPRMLEEEMRTGITERFREYGFSYVALDLRGYRTGSMNEMLRRQE